MGERLELTYRLRLRDWDPDYHNADAWLESNKYAFPFILMRMIGTERKGWPWARYDRPIFERLGAVSDLDHAMSAIREDVEKRLDRHRQKLLAEAKRAHFKEPRDISVVVVLSDDPENDTITINP